MNSFLCDSKIGQCLLAGVLVVFGFLAPIRAFSAEALTKDEIKCIRAAIQDYIKNHPEIYFIHDGCCGRAWSLYDEVIIACPSAKDKIRQNWLVGRLCPKPGIIWGFHTALCIWDKDDDVFVLDPAFGTDYIPYADWYKMCKAQGETKCDTTLCKKISTCLPKYPGFKPDPDQGKKSKCYYPCWGAEIKALQDCDDKTGQEQIDCIKAATTACDTCAKACKDKGIDPPFKNFQNGDTQSCSWAAGFKGTARTARASDQSFGILGSDAAVCTTDTTDGDFTFDSMFLASEATRSLSAAEGQPGILPTPLSDAASYSDYVSFLPYYFSDEMGDICPVDGYLSDAPTPEVIPTVTTPLNGLSDSNGTIWDIDSTPADSSNTCAPNY